MTVLPVSDSQHSKLMACDFESLQIDVRLGRVNALVIIKHRDAETPRLVILQQSSAEVA
jgi:hypothetical protein